MTLNGTVTAIHQGQTGGNTPKPFTAYRILDLEGEGEFHRLMDYENQLKLKEGDKVSCRVSLSVWQGKRGVGYQLVFHSLVNGNGATKEGRV